MLMAPSSQLLCPPFVQHVKTVFNFSFCESELAMVTCVPCARFIKSTCWPAATEKSRWKQYPAPPVDGLSYVLVNLLWNSNWREIWILYQSGEISSEVKTWGNLNFSRSKYHQQKEFCRWQNCFMKSCQAPLLTLCYHQTPLFWKWSSKWRKNYLSEWKWKLFVWVKTRMICLRGNTNYLSEWKQELFVWVETRII